MAYNSNFDVLKSGKIILFCFIMIILMFFAQLVCALAMGEDSDVGKDLQNLQKNNTDLVTMFKLAFHFLTFSIIPFPFNIIPLLFNIIMGIIIVYFVINELLALIPSWL